MRLPVFVLLSLAVSLTGCTQILETKAQPLKAKLFTPYKSTSKITISNVSNKGVTRIYGLIHYDLKKSSQSVIEALSQKLSEAGITLDNNSGKELKIAIDEISFPNKAPFSFPCEFDVTLETGDGKVKHFTTRNRSGNGYIPACDYAMAKVVAEIYNDEDIRSYIDGKSYVPESEKKKNATTGGASAKERLQKLKELLDQGLISRGDYNKKKDAILNEM